MKITCKTVGGGNFEVDVEGTDTVKALKEKISSQQDADRYPVDGTKLLFKGKALEDGQTLESCSIEEKSFIVVFAPKKKAAPAAAAAAPSAPAAAASAPAAPAPPTIAVKDAPATTAGEDGAEPEAPEDMDADPQPAAGAPATGAGAFATGADLQASVKAITEMGFSEDDVKRAMRAAFNNPERAVEYLMTGLPDAATAAAPMAATPMADGGAGGVAGVVPPGAAGAATPAGPPAAAAAAAGPNAAPLDMWASGGGAGGLGADDGAAEGGPGEAALAALRQNPAQLAQMLSGDPNMMGALAQLVRSNPELWAAMQRDPSSIMQLMQGLGAGGAGAGGDDAGAPPPGATQIELTEEEAAAITRLEGLGFPRDECIQAYLVCEKQETLAANYLLNERMNEDE